jgi:malonyl-CoA O-methyltransferase
MKKDFNNLDDNAAYVSPMQGFSELADTYDVRLSSNPLLLLETTATLSALPNLEGKVAVDVGCGTGRYALQMLRMGASRVTGVDIALPMLAQAQKKAKKAGLPLTIAQGDLLDTISLPESSYDVAVCAMVLAFLPEVKAAFQTLGRLVKNGGSLIISDVHPMTGFMPPYLRFANLHGEEWRIRRHLHLISTLIGAAQEAGFAFEHLAEPVVDRRLATTYPHLWDAMDKPLSLTLRFRKG